MSIDEGSKSIGGRREGTNDATILLADDDPLMRHLCSLALSREGLTVQAFPNGGEAWSALERREYDLIVTDNDMPVLTGLEIIGKLRSAHRAIPVVLISGTGTAESLCKDAQYTECAFLLKPFPADRLLELVKGFLAASRAKRANLPPSEMENE